MISTLNSITFEMAKFSSEFRIISFSIMNYEYSGLIGRLYHDVQHNH
ncbi:hypothetical protein MWLf4_0187 [Limosilactobacillus fermentum]|nr:hypothetical protein MWLf4_0187 [Limosilactobacillus fermentum]